MSLSYGVNLMEIFAIEFESGYFWGEDTGSFDAELWGVPVLVNAKLSLPVLMFDLYGGAGLGGFYLDAEAGPLDDDDWVFGGDVFLGADFDLGPLSIGAEVKYFIAENTDLFGTHVQFEGAAAMVTAVFTF